MDFQPAPGGTSNDGTTLCGASNEGPTLCDILRLPRELCTPCAPADVVAAALVSHVTLDALLEATGGKLHRLTVRLLVPDVRRFAWAVFTFGMPCSDAEVAVVAAGEGALDTLQWLADDRERPGGTNSVAVAAGRGASVPWGVGVCREAARGGHLHVLRYARLLLGCPWDASVCANAASAGHLHVLQWLREKGCAMDKMTTAWAELKYQQGCEPFARTHRTTTTSRAHAPTEPHSRPARRSGHHEVKEWAIANGCDYSADLVLRMRMARVMAMSAHSDGGGGEGFLQS